MTKIICGIECHFLWQINYSNTIVDMQHPRTETFILKKEINVTGKKTNQ